MAKTSFPTLVCSLILSKRIKAFFTILLCVPFLGVSCLLPDVSSVHIKGTVKSSDGEIIAGAMIVIKNGRNENEAYCQSNDKGNFSLTYSGLLSERSVHFSCMGFEELIVPISRLGDKSVFTLKKKAFELKEVTVRVPPVSAKGDTLSYNVDSFRNASDRMIEDVLKKRPGINVSNDGRIYYKGEAINKFYIEGLDLLSGRYALASRNISPDDVVSINIYENHQAKKVLRDIEYSDKAALDLKLKNKSILRPIGYIKAGMGLNTVKDILGIGELFGLFVSPKCQLLLTAKGNNCGNSYQDETRVLTENRLDEKSMMTAIYPDNPFGSVNIPSSRYQTNRSGSGSLNFVRKIGKDRQLNITADYKDDYVEYFNARFVRYITGKNEESIINESTDSRPHLRETKIKINFENNSDYNYISDRVSFTGHFKSNNYAVKFERIVDQKVKTTDFDIRNEFDGTFRISKHVIGFKSDLKVGLTPTNRLSAVTNNIKFIEQNVRGQYIRNREQFAYSWLINEKSFIGVNTSFNFEYDIFNSTDKSQHKKNWENDVRGYKITTNIEPLYQLKLHRSLILNLSIPFRLSDLKYSDVEKRKNFPAHRFDIDFKARLHYNAPFNLKSIFAVGKTSRLGNISDYITSPVFVTFRQSSVPGTGGLNKKHSMYVNEQLSYRNAINGIFVSSSLMFTSTRSNKLAAIDINGNESISDIQKSLANRSNIFNTDFRLSKKFYQWNSSFAIHCSYEYSNRKIIRKDKIFGISNSGYTLNLKIDSNPWNNYLIMSLDARYSYSGQKVSSFNNRSSSSQKSLNIVLSSFPIKKLELTFKSFFNRDSAGEGKSNNSIFLDAGICYKIKGFDLELNAHNLANSKTYGYSFLKDSELYYYSYKLRPLEILLAIRYSF